MGRRAPWHPSVTLPFSRPSPADNRLQVNQTHRNITVLENQWVTLECQVSSRTSPSSQLSVEWYVWRPGHPEKEAVARLSRQSTLRYGDPAALGDLRGRIHMESPSLGLYLLSIQNATVRDSGVYDCRVEEWLLDPSDRWYKRAEDLSGLTTLTVKQPGEEDLVPPPWSSSLPSWVTICLSLTEGLGRGHGCCSTGHADAFVGVFIGPLLFWKEHAASSVSTARQAWDFVTTASANLFFYSSFGRFSGAGFRFYSHLD